MNEYEETRISRLYERYNIRSPQRIALQLTTECGQRFSWTCQGQARRLPDQVLRARVGLPVKVPQPQPVSCSSLSGFAPYPTVERLC